MDRYIILAFFLWIITSVAFCRTSAKPDTIAADTVCGKDSSVFKNVLLHDVVIKSRRRLASKTDRGLVYNMAGDKEAKRENILQALGRVPLVNVSADGEISIKGATHYRIFLNGQPYDMAEASPRQVLRSLPASAVKRIEVITEETAEFGNVGGQPILNIITEKNALDGFYTNISGGGSTQPTAKSGVLAMAKKKMIDFSFGYNYDLNGQRNQPIEQVSVQDGITYNIDGEGDGDWHTHLLRGIVNVRVDSLNTVYADVHGKILKTDFTTTWVQSTDASANKSTIESTNTSSSGTVEANAIYRNYSRRNPSRERFSIGYRYTYNPDKRKFRQSLPSSSLLPEYTVLETDGSLNEHTINTSFLLLVKTFLVRLSANNVARIGDVESTDGNSIDYKQYVSNLSASCSGRIGTMDCNMGLEGYLGNLEMNVPNGIVESYHRSQTYLSPSLSVRWHITKNAELKLSYLRRLTAPSIVMLNPFYSVTNNRYASQGNPDLDMEKNDNVSLAWQYFRNNFYVEMKGYLMNVNDAILEYQKDVDKDNRIVSTYENLGKTKNIGVQTFLYWQPAKVFSANAYCDISYYEINAPLIALEQHDCNVFANMKANLYFPKNWSLSAMYTFSKQKAAPWQKVSSTNSCSLRLDKSWFNGALTAGMELNTPYRKYTKLKKTTESPMFYSAQTNYITARSLGVNISYTFQSGKKINMRRDRTLMNNDLKTGVE